MDSKRTVVDFRKRRFIQLTREVVHNTDKLTKPVEIAVYAVLCMYADNTDKTSYPSVATIAEKARCSERVVHRALIVLKDAGYIDIVNRTDRNGFKTSNQYVLLDVEDSALTPTEPKEKVIVGGINWSNRPLWQFDMFEDFGKSCALSGAVDNLSLDHVLPRQKDASRNSYGNIIPLSLNLNISKHNNNLFDWFDKNCVRLDLPRDRFDKLIEYLAYQNKMTVKEYKRYYFSEYESYVTYKGG